MAQLTKADFDVFRKECQRLISIFGLQEWSDYYEFGALEDCYAQVRMNYEGRVATLALNKEWPEDNRRPSRDELKKTALHEVLHILIYPIRANGGKRYIVEGTMNEIEEGTVNRLCRVLEGKV